MIKTDVYICEGEFTEEIKPYEKQIIRVCSTAMEKDMVSGTLNISFVSEEEIQRLNLSYRNVDSVTDVLSFPANLLEKPIARSGITCDMEIEDDMVVLGDIAVCVKRANEQAEEYGHSFERELCFLALHGTLHVLGYDHVTPDGEQEMFGLQNEILEFLGIVR